MAEGDLDAVAQQVQKKMRKICEEIHHVHKVEESNDVFALMEGKVAEGDRWFQILNSARTGEGLFGVVTSCGWLQKTIFVWLQRVCYSGGAGPSNSQTSSLVV